MKETLSSGLSLGTKLNLLCVKIKLTKKNIGVSKYLFKNGFLNSYFLDKSNHKLILYFSSSYTGKRTINEVKKISSPGRKICISCQYLKKMLYYKNHFLILSTSKGILNNREAISRNLGGELLYIIKC